MTKAVSLAALMIFVGCSDDANRVVDPDPDSNAQVFEVPFAPLTPNHTGENAGDVFRWSAPTNADDVQLMGYNVYIYDPQPDTNASYTRLNGAPIADEVFLARNLVEGETYWFRVAALNGNAEEGEWSEPASFVATGRRGGLTEQETELPEIPGPYQP